MNSIVVSGRLVSDGNVMDTGSTKIWKNCVAVQRDYKEKGSDKYETDFFDLTAFGNTVDYLSKYAKKGDNVIVQGKMYFDEYTGKDGVKRKNHYIKVDTVNVLVKYTGKDANATPSTNPNGLQPVEEDADFTETTLEDGEDIPF